MTARARSFGRRAFLGAALAAPCASALGRIAYGGGLRVDLPLWLEGLDPHVGDDPASAILSAALFDTLYAWDSSGRPYPVLARALPEAGDRGVKLALRPGIVTARGRPIDATDVVASLERARRLAARPLLSAFGSVRRARGDALGVEIDGVAVDVVADALSSPTTAIVPRAFSPRLPDGTGAFRADPSPAGLVLSRNERAARGPSFLDRIEVRRAPDLASGLRAFESGAADIGFLGAGLHRRRADAVDFRTEPVGWVVFRTGPEAGDWGAPGVAARLVQAIEPGRLSQLGLAPPAAAKSSGDTGWGGGSANLYVDEASPYLVEVARAIATAFSRPGHDIRPSPLPHSELSRLRDGGHFAVLIDFARRLGPTAHHAALSLIVSANPRLSDKPPRGLRDDIDIVQRTLSLAALGELKIAGARAPDVHGLEQWELGSVFRGG